MGMETEPVRRPQAVRRASQPRARTTRGEDDSRKPYLFARLVDTRPAQYPDSRIDAPCSRSSRRLPAVVVSGSPLTVARPSRVLTGFLVRERYSAVVYALASDSFSARASDMTKRRALQRGRDARRGSRLYRSRSTSTLARRPPNYMRWHCRTAGRAKSSRFRHFGNGAAFAVSPRERLAKGDQCSDGPDRMRKPAVGAGTFRAR